MKFVDRFLQKWRINRARHWLQPGMRVLDIGCADGALFRHCVELDDGVGIDPDVPAPWKVRENAIVPGMFPADLPDRRPFDAITMLAVLEHIPREAQPGLANDCAAYLKPGGYLIITVPAPTVDHILAVLKAIRLIDGMSLEQHYGFDIATTAPTFEAPGLKLVAWKWFQLGLNNVFVFQKPPA
jgi:cyclopropane fatty-acyl-phospholipid synthase-like methyltransferase